MLAGGESGDIAARGGLSIQSVAFFFSIFVFPVVFHNVWKSTQPKYSVATAERIYSVSIHQGNRAYTL